MRKLFFSILFALSGLAPYHASAQLNINVNLGSQPAWGPSGYDRADYYYLPDVQTYYYVPERQFIHMNNSGRWTFTNSLPYRYRNYDLYRGRKIVINSPRPYLHFREHRMKYPRGPKYYRSYNSNPGRRMAMYRVRSNNRGPAGMAFGPSRGRGVGHFKENGHGHFKENGHGHFKGGGHGRR